MKIFVVGATGVLGRLLMPLFLQKGYIVRALARSNEKARALELAGVEAVQGDLLEAGTVKRLPETMKGCDSVVHIATAIPLISDSSRPGVWETTARLRTEGTQALLSSTLAVGAQRYIQQSIVLAYPDGGDRWLDESTPFDASPKRAAVNGPVSAMEEMVRAIAPEQLHWCILRGGSFVGPETMQDEQLAMVRVGQWIVPCDGSNYLSLINVADMAAAVAALESAPPASIFNIVDEPIRNGDYCDHLADLLEAPHPPRDLGKRCPRSLRCRNQAARTALGWTPIHSIWPTTAQLTIYREGHDLSARRSTAWS
jgi:nucleoside-diphosphate-sugar epimerase